MTETIDLSTYLHRTEEAELLPWSGEVVELVGMLIASRGPAAAVGDFCEIATSSGRRIRTQVVGFRNGHVLSLPLEETDGIQLHDRIIARGGEARVAVSPDLAGRVLDGFGKPMDRGRAIRPAAYYPLYRTLESPLDREHIVEPMATGIRAIDTLIPIGSGQRMGIFGGSGVGKSTLLGAMARRNSAEITVVAMIGERNREVRAFLEHELGPEGRARSIVVCATSDKPAPLRVRACFVALAVAEYFLRSGRQCIADYGFRHPPRHGAARDRIGRRRAPEPERLHPIRFQPAPAYSGTRRELPTRRHHRLLHGAGGGRRFQRADLRCGPRDSRRPHRAFA